MLDINNEKSRTSFVPPNKYDELSSDMHSDTQLLTNSTQPSYIHHMHFLPGHSGQHISSRPSYTSNLPTHTLSSPSKNSIDFCPVKTTPLSINSTRVNNNNLCLSLNTCTNTLSMPSTLSPAYLPHISERSYNLSKHLFWNTNFFYTQSKSSNGDSSLSYPENIGNILNQKFCNQPFSEYKNDLSFISNCSDVNSDDSIDVSENEKKNQKSQRLKKRNPYSIEELLKKPDKKTRHYTSNASNFIHKGSEAPDESINSQISVKVCN